MDRAKWLATVIVGVVVAHAQGQVSLDRTSLPVAEPSRPPITELDARNAKAPPRFEVRAPDGAPNVLLVLIDDFGFGQASAFGGGVQTPTLERLAQGGLKYNRFHVTALCSPTRMALLTGRNHHSAGMGSVTEIATGFYGNNAVRPNSVAPLAETLRLNGYATAAFGKYHETAAWEVSPSGPTDRWPTRSGFDKFYGFIGGETNQWAPAIFDGMTRVETPSDPNYHFTTDMANQAIAWMRSQQGLTPDRPFFIYWAPGATHAPHHVGKEWADKYKGKFDAGWDAYREETLKRQIALGVVPPGTKLAPKPAAMKDWDKLSADEKKLFARQMEVYAGFGEHTDHETGRLVSAIEDMGALDNTLVIYIQGDNGASAEGGLSGLFNETTFFNGIPEKQEDILHRMDELGGPNSYPHFSAFWAIAGNTPFPWSKQAASHLGGTRSPMVVHWPKGIKAKGEVRPQYSHVIDVAPTVLEAAALPEPKAVNGTVQKPIEGVSFLYSFDDVGAKDRHITQYFEIMGNRGIYHDGWVAGTLHRIPWESKARTTLQNDTWELYNLNDDFSESENLAAKHPDKLKEMQELFLKEAVKYSVLPLDDRGVERFNAAIAGRPDLMGTRTSLTLYPGHMGLTDNTFINTKNRSHSITAALEIPEGGKVNGVILSQGGRFAGWSVYVKDGKPEYHYNWVGLEHFTISGPDKLPEGNVTLRFEFAFDGGQPGAGGQGTLLVNSKKVAEGRIDKTMPFAISGDEIIAVGMDEDTPVTDAYPQGRENRFNGTIHTVTVDLK